MDLKTALAELRKDKKRKFVQTVDLIVNLQSFDVRKEALNSFISIPFAGEKKIAAFLTKPSKLLPTITEEDFGKYKDANDMKKLALDYDYFISSVAMMKKIATSFGRVFGPLGKMPSPQAGIITQETDAAVADMLDKMKKIVRIRTKEMSIKIAVGKESMKDDDLIKNIESALAQIETKVPRGKECMKDALVKFTMTKAIKFMNYNQKNENQN